MENSFSASVLVEDLVEASMLDRVEASMLDRVERVC